MQEKSKTYEKSPRRVFIRTFGCQMNVADSESIAGFLSEAGHKIVRDESSADIVLLNTCCVRQLAEEKVWSKLGELHSKYNGKKILGVIGCMAQQYSKGIFERAPYVNLVCGTYRFRNIDELLGKVINGKRVIDVETAEDDEDINVFTKRDNKVCAFVPISRGCDNRCSYCVVPYVRGPERNRPADEIILEIKELAEKGYKEVTLLGQNVNSYIYKSKIQNPKSKNNFIGLLERINDISGIERIRFVTSHPKDASVDLFRAIGELDKVCEYLHLPVQNGSNRILERMNRGYTREHYLELIEKLRKIVPGISISTDVIVGFPDETEEDFMGTYNLMKEVGFDSAFIFKYSLRPGTIAADYEDNVPMDIKMERNQCLLKLQDEISLKKNKPLIGGVLEVLVERISKNNKNRLMGRTRTNKIVVFEGSQDLIGSLLSVRILSATPHTLIGERRENE